MVCHGLRFLSFNALDSGLLVMAVHDMFVHGELLAQVLVIHRNGKLLRGNIYEVFEVF